MNGAREQLIHGLDVAHPTGATERARRAQEELATLGARPNRLVLTGVGVSPLVSAESGG